MKEEEKLEIAKFRFGVISDFVTGVRFGHGEREKLLRDKCALKYTIPYSTRTTVSRGSIAFWIAKYRASGNQLSGFMPLTRADAGTYKKLDLSVRMAIAELKKDNPTWNLETIIAKLREKYVLKPDEQINRATCYRFLQTFLLCVDEAQLLRVDVLMELHTLSQHIYDSKNLLPLVLCGQNNLLDNLQYRTCAPIASRVVARHHFQPLKSSSAEEYILHHVRVAKLKHNPFDESAMTAIFQSSGGILRRINNLARGSLPKLGETKFKLGNTHLYPHVSTSPCACSTD